MSEGDKDGDERVREILSNPERWVPDPDRIGELLRGTCHHGKDVMLCQECSTDRLYEESVVNICRLLGVEGDGARAVAVEQIERLRAPRCVHVGCEAFATWRCHFRVFLRGAGDASGRYEGDLDDGGTAGGLCDAHRREHERHRNAHDRQIVERILAARGAAAPSECRWTVHREWAAIPERRPS